MNEVYWISLQIYQIFLINPKEIPDGLKMTAMMSDATFFFFLQ